MVNKKEIAVRRIVEIVVPQKFLVFSKFTRKIPCLNIEQSIDQIRQRSTILLFLPTSMNGKSQ